MHQAPPDDTPVDVDNALGDINDQATTPQHVCTVEDTEPAAGRVDDDNVYDYCEDNDNDGDLVYQGMVGAPTTCADVAEKLEYMT